MSESKRALDELATLVRKGGSEMEQLIRRQHALAKRKLARVLKALMLMVVSALVIVPTMIARTARSMNVTGLLSILIVVS